MKYAQNAIKNGINIYHDKFIQDAQLNANDYYKVIEWIPYDRLIGKGGLMDGYIDKWDIENQQWKRRALNTINKKKISSDEICPKCNQEWNKYLPWCKPCNSKHFQNDFNNWTSGNDKIDKFIQDAQLNANDYYKVIEWIPYDRLIGKGGLMDGYIDKWDIENQQWKRRGEEVALKSLIILWKFTLNHPLQSNFMELHKIQKHHIYDGLEYVKPSRIFKSGLEISDFGLSKLLGANPDGPEKKNIVGVLPYISPEVLSGEEEYTKATDVYSFEIISYEIVTGFPPYPNIPHDEDLAIKICNGLRPKIPFRIPKLITRTIMRCWDARVTHRLTFRELSEELEKYYDDYADYLREESANTTNTTTTTPLNYQTHPHAIYTSRLPKPKNEENFEKELEELTKSFSHDDIDEF
ncbi:hypothetical protein Glove_482g38 [Diversispora epigaea]|uniref:Protein kinase domain-containing protein n=1 Tax=Diversispora epigaea TaxID=1348612 RepID=A0A397GLR5_9GLOM|nr:hypothetical protein Glove_482g38 [Diversispora epigaea]